MRQKMGLSLRKQYTSPLSPEARIKQDQLYEITMQRIVLLLDEGLKSKYVIGSDEFEMWRMRMLDEGQEEGEEEEEEEESGVVRELLSTHSVWLGM
jgi:hypothetical protein